jgi:menaquinol-cytochrome c reductase iron-sulfur subunit
MSAIGGLLGLLMGIPAIAYLIDPRNRPSSGGVYKPAARLSELEENVPKAAVIRDVRRDAWTLHQNDVIGRVWLIRRAENNEDGLPKIDAYTTICPHLGGPINFNATTQCFVCPLHGATFDLLCTRVLAKPSDPGWTNPAPRDMDSLEVQLEREQETGDFIIKVKYENFVQGKEQKVRKA